MRHILLFILSFFLLVLTYHQSSARSFQSFLSEMKVKALASGISERTLNKTFPTIKYVAKSVALDHKQNEFTITFEKYQQNQLPQSRIKKAIHFLRDNKVIFDKIEQKYHVPREQIVALWAIESNFGQNTGKFHIPSVLATLAYDGRRAELFTNQLMDALKIIEQGHIEPRAMIGSWAGAMGQSQFMCQRELMTRAY